MAREISNPLTQPKEIAANRRGQITKRQRPILSGVIKQKQQWWVTVAVIGLMPTFAPLLGVVTKRSDSGGWAIGLLCVSAGLFCLWFAPSVLMALRWRWLGKNLTHEPIAQGVGTVYWKRRRYVLALIDGKRKLDPIRTPNLLPGRYRFYYLPRYHWLLTAERLEGAPHADDLKRLNHHLAQANRFRPDALAANRAGRLTGSQKASLWGQFAVYAIGGFIATALFFVYFVRETRIYEIYEIPWFLITLVIIVTVVALLFLRHNLGSLVDYLQGQVLATEGVVTKELHMSFDHEYQSVTASYCYDVNKHSFSVKEAGYQALIDDLTYRLYFLPRSQKLVNIEVLMKVSI